jgi:uncharacterized protein (TIGR02677 family)
MQENFTEEIKETFPTENANSVETTSVAASLAFGLTDKIPIFNYLVTSERVGWYRTIMRVFAQRHRELYRYQLTAQEVWEEVRRQFDPEYTLEKCQTDLRSLEDWGNIITTHDASRHTSIASFRSPALLYQATPLAIAIEGFLEEQRRLGSMAGALRQGDLARLWEMLQQLDRLINRAEPDTRQIAEEWRRLFELFNTMAREAAQYLANMIASARLPRPSLEAYQGYKRSVVEYVTNFGQALAHYSQLFRNLLKSWFSSERQTVLVEAVAEHLQPPGIEPERALPRAALVREAGNQLNALVNWFSAGSNADVFRRAAATEVEKVVRRAEQLAAATRPNTNYAADLDGLARRMLEAVQPEENSQLLLVAFGHALPGHLPESLVRPSGTTGSRPAWEEAPNVTPTLREIGRARGDKTPELPINANREAELALIEQRRLQRLEELERFSALFSVGTLDLAEVVLHSAAERNALLAAVQGCLRDSRHQYRAPDGSTIVLLNPAETNYGLLRAPDGALLMPRYRLVRQEKGKGVGAR